MRSYRAHNAERIEAVQGMPLAPFRARAAAFLVDFLLIFLIAMAAAVPAVLLTREPNKSFVIHFDPFKSVLGASAFVLYFGLATFLGRGRTPGKRLLRIRVISLAGERLTFWQSIGRALGYASSAAIAGLGFFEFFQHPNRQTTHDRIAETIVVTERTKRKRTDETGAPPEAAPETTG